jgi:hydrogenase maturation protease
MDVAFRMRGAGRVILVDAAHTGVAPGTVFRVPSEELAAVGAIERLASHEFRWDHALAFGHWLLGEQMPKGVEVILIEGESFGLGEGLSPVVDAAVDAVGEVLVREIRRVVEAGRGAEAGAGERGAGGAGVESCRVAVGDGVSGVGAGVGGRDGAEVGGTRGVGGVGGCYCGGCGCGAGDAGRGVGRDVGVGGRVSAPGGCSCGGGRESGLGDCSCGRGER